MSVSAGQRFTNERPCPVCGGCVKDKRGIGQRCYGFLSEGGLWASCTRPEFAGACSFHQASSTFSHYLGGDCRCGESHGGASEPKVNTNGHRQIVATYSYCDEEGNQLYQTVRYSDKSFKARRSNGIGDWIYNVENTRRVLYHLPKLLAADPSQWTFLCEGEKDADNLIGYGLVATCNPFGAGKWATEYNGALEGHRVIILVDNDDEGRRHYQKVANSLYGTAAVVKVLSLPELVEHGDISDWLELGHTVDDLLLEVERCPEWEPPAEESEESANFKWEDPQPFDAVAVPPFSISTLPPGIAEYVSQESQSKQVPVDLPGTLVIGALAVSSASRCKVSITEDWQEPLNLFIADVLPSGERKSPEFRSILKPLEDVEQELVKEQALEVLRAKTEHDILEQRWKNAKAEAARAKPDDRITAEAEARGYAEQLASFEIPTSIRLLADDATPEAVAGLLADQKGRLTIASTEGGLFEAAHGRYSNDVPNLDVFLKGYSGDPVRVDRRSRLPEFVRNPALTIILTVQPDVIVDLASRKAFRGRGFLARWLYSMPKSKVGYRSIDAPTVREESRKVWNSLLRAILSLPVPDDSYIPLIRLSVQARDVFREFRREVEVNLRPGEELDDLADWGNKLPGQVARIAGLLHIARWATNSEDSGDSGYTPAPWESEITQETMEAAVSLGHYFEGHAKAAFALMGSDGKIASARKVWAVVEKHNLETFTVRDLW
jgi:putative DNA primase/helicase